MWLSECSGMLQLHFCKFMATNILGSVSSLVSIAKLSAWDLQKQTYFESFSLQGSCDLKKVTFFVDSSFFQDLSSKQRGRGIEKTFSFTSFYLKQCLKWQEML